ncbi:MAG TPA: type II CAAX endopeptidase family protein, partial [Pirellulales bacterium]|nr:type II CAAX endopeptidase family protein [Pirellulales bacterium]
MDADRALDRRPLPRGLRWAAIVFALGFPSLLTWVYFIALDGHAAGIQQAAYVVGKTIQFVFPAFWVFVVERQRLERLALSGRGLMLGIAFGTVISAAMFGAYFGGLANSNVMLSAAAIVRQRLASFGVTNPAVMIAAGAFYAIIHSLLEEYYWRWFAFGELRRLVSLRTAIVVSSLAFTGHHVIVLVKYLPEMPWWPLASLAVAIGGAAWAWLYHRSRSLLAPWISHAIVDAALFAIGYSMAFGP